MVLAVILVTVNLTVIYASYKGKCRHHNICYKCDGRGRDRVFKEVCSRCGGTGKHYGYKTQ